MTSVALQAAVLLVAGDVAQLRAACCSLSTRRGVQIAQLVRVGVFQAVLILRAADAIFDRQSCTGCMYSVMPVDLRQLRLQPADDLGGARRCAPRAASG